MPKKYNPIRNLKHYAYKAKLPSEAKIGADKVKKLKLGTPTVKKPSRKRIRKMATPKGI
jgi:hypothetical protein